MITGADGDTFHGDHGYVQYQIPPSPRRLPVVMWHGGLQSAKTWESTPDGRDGYQNVLLRHGFSTYIIDQPRRGRAGRSSIGVATPGAYPGEAGLFNSFRLGTWEPPSPPVWFPGVQFSQEPEALAQYWRQCTPNTGFEAYDDVSRALHSDAMAALLERVGPSVLLTHSNSGQYGWRTAIKSRNVRAVVSYEPVNFAFPRDAPPRAPALPSAIEHVEAIQVPDLLSEQDFAMLTEIPIQLVYGDNIQSRPTAILGMELWRTNIEYAKQFVGEINRRGGKADLLLLPERGIFGNTHFPMSDLNNVAVADELFNYLSRHGLDR